MRQVFCLFSFYSVFLDIEMALSLVRFAKGLNKVSLGKCGLKELLVLSYPPSFFFGRTILNVV